MDPMEQREWEEKLRASGEVALRDGFDRPNELVVKGEAAADEFKDIVAQFAPDNHVPILRDWVPPSVDYNSIGTFKGKPIASYLYRYPSVGIIYPFYKRAVLMELGGISLNLSLTGELPNVHAFIVDDGPQDVRNRQAFENIRDHAFANKCRIEWSYLPNHQRFSNPDNDTEWRTPAWAINKGFWIARNREHCDIMVLACPEMFFFPGTLERMVATVEADAYALAVPELRDDMEGRALRQLQSSDESTVNPHAVLGGRTFETLPGLEASLPFLMAMRGDIFQTIGGYDEDMRGTSFDDNDITGRLQEVGCHVVRVRDARGVHLFHPRGTADNHGKDTQARYEFNKRLYLERKGFPVRNKNRPWGQG